MTVEAAGQPGAGEGPVALDAAGRAAGRGGGLLDAQAGEVAEHYDLAHARVVAAQLAQGGVEFEHGGGRLGLLGRVVVADADDGGLGEVDPPPPAAVLLGRVVPRPLDEDAPHRLRGRAEKVPRAVPGDLRVLHQPQVDLVDQRRRLERQLRPLVAHAAAG